MVSAVEAATDSYLEVLEALGPFAEETDVSAVAVVEALADMIAAVQLPVGRDGGPAEGGVPRQVEFLESGTAVLDQNHRETKQIGASQLQYPEYSLRFVKTR